MCGWLHLLFNHRRRQRSAPVKTMRACSHRPGSLGSTEIALVRVFSQDGLIDVVRCAVRGLFYKADDKTVTSPKLSMA